MGIKFTREPNECCRRWTGMSHHEWFWQRNLPARYRVPQSKGESLRKVSQWTMWCYAFLRCRSKTQKCPRRGQVRVGHRLPEGTYDRLHHHQSNKPLSFSSRSTSSLWPAGPSNSRVSGEGQTCLAHTSLQVSEPEKGRNLTSDKWDWTS